MPTTRQLVFLCCMYVSDHMHRVCTMCSTKMSKAGTLAHALDQLQVCLDSQGFSLYHDTHIYMCYPKAPAWHVCAVIFMHRAGLIILLVRKTLQTLKHKRQQQPA